MYQNTHRSHVRTVMAGCAGWSLGLALVLGIPMGAQATILIPVTDDSPFDSDADSFDKFANFRSHGGQVAAAVRKALSGSTPSAGQDTSPGIVSGSAGGDDHQRTSPDVQVNDPNLDNIQSFPGLTRPFEGSTQSETSLASVGRHVLAGYNTSAGNTVVRVGNDLFFSQLRYSGYSISHDGGKTWTSGFIPPLDGSDITFGDPSVATDRQGNFYYSHLAADAFGNGVVAISKSTDHGNSFSPSTVVAADDGSDKNWLAIGPDPTVRSRDNLYLTWTRFTPAGSDLMLSRSVDAGATWTTQVLFTPTPTAAVSSAVQFSNPVVDKSTGRLYVPFLNFGNLDPDFIRVLVSDDGGVTFRFLKFNVPGAPDLFAYPTVIPGEITDCGTGGGTRNVLHQGPNLGGGRFGLARYRFATRLVTQPATAAAHGRLLIAFHSSTSPFFGDPSSGSEINLLYSNDGGTTWAPPVRVAASTAADPQHVHPAITLDGDDGDSALVAYYVQQADSKLRTDVSRLHFRAGQWLVNGASNLSTQSFDLTPSNIPRPVPTDPFLTTNYDRNVNACYNLGEYMSIVSHDDRAMAAWGDNRRTWTGPADSSAPGPHAQADVFFRRSSDDQ
jgi:hypothetical protein